MKYAVVNTRQKLVASPDGHLYSLKDFELTFNDPAGLLFFDKVDAERKCQHFISPKFKVVEVIE